MLNHTKVYLSYFGYDTSDWIPCEVCHGTCADVHHIEARGHFGKKNQDKDDIFNLMGLCREHHNPNFVSSKEQKEYLFNQHINFIEQWYYESKY